MAVNDAVAAFLGTAETNRQPASGVEEQISSVVQTGSTDGMFLYDGTNTLAIVNSGRQTHIASNDANAGPTGALNMAIMITNSIYLRKLGTTDRIYVGGVQTNV